MSDDKDKKKWSEVDQVVELIKNHLGEIELVDTCSLEARNRRYVL